MLACRQRRSARVVHLGLLRLSECVTQTPLLRLTLLFYTRSILPAARFSSSDDPDQDRDLDSNIYTGMDN